MKDKEMRDEFVLPPDDSDVSGADPFIQSVAVALRAPENVSEGFEEAVMHSVRLAAGVYRAYGRRPWWKRDVIRLTPIGAIALAAGLAGIAYLGTISVDGTDTETADQPATLAAAADQTERVRFVFVDATARQVAVVGSFNQWQKDATPLQVTGVPGVWAVSVPLTPGRHEYAFVVDGKRWEPDPFAPGVTDEFGTESSVVRIGQAPTSS